MKVVVLAGGLSSERNVSLSSGAMICAALKERGHQAALVDLFLGLEDYDRPVGDLFDCPPPLPDLSVGAEEPDLDAVRASRRDKSASIFGPGVLEVCRLADVVFLGLHGACGEDGRVQAAFDLLGIAYTGSGYLGSAIAMDKDFTKRLARAEGVRTPDWTLETVTADRLDDLKKRPVPCVVKVPNGGSSIGVSVCRTGEELSAALDRVVGQSVILEEYISGREFSCGVLDGESLPPIEIIPRTGFYNYENKYQKGAALEVCPARIDGEAEAVMRGAALRVHRMLQLSAYSRSDFLLTEDGKVYFLEINTLPGMTPTSLLPQEAAAVGIDYPALCQKIIDIAMKERG